MHARQVFTPYNSYYEELGTILSCHSHNPIGGIISSQKRQKRLLGHQPPTPSSSIPIPLSDSRPPSFALTHDSLNTMYIPHHHPKSPPKHRDPTPIPQRRTGKPTHLGEMRYLHSLHITPLPLTLTAHEHLHFQLRLGLRPPPTSCLDLSLSLPTNTKKATIFRYLIPNPASDSLGGTFGRAYPTICPGRRLF